MPFCLSAQTANLDENAGLLPLTFFIGRLVLGVMHAERGKEKCDLRTESADVTSREKTQFLRKELN
jgi:hypothetical protein